MKKTILFLLTFLLIPFVFANDEGIVNQQTQLWADILDGATYYNPTGANISVYYPNGTTAISNQPMQQIATGRYLYNYTGNITGTYYTFTQFYNTTAVVATATSTFYIAENSEMMMTILLGLIFCSIFLLFIGLYLMTRQNQTPIFGGIFKNFLIGDFGFMLFMLAILSTNAIPAFLLQLDSANTYDSLLLPLWQIWLILTIFSTIILGLFYMFLRNAMLSLEHVKFKPTKTHGGRQ